MQYSWLEKMVKEGHVRPAVRDSIYASCSDILTKAAGVGQYEDFFKKHFKVPADFPGSAKEWIQGSNPLLHQAMTLLSTVGIVGGAAAYYAAKTGLSDSKDIKTIIENRQAILSDPAVERYKEKASARFDEVVKVAPKVATQKELIKRLVLDRLHSGFTSNDYQNFAGIQASYAPQSKDTGRVAKKYESASKTASMSAEASGSICADVVLLLKDAGLDKVAATPVAGGIFDSVKRILATMGVVSGVGVVTGLGAGAVNAVSHAMDEAKLKKNLKKSYDEAMRRSDPNREPLHANKDKARQAFETLVHFAPHVAVEPSAARAFMNTIVSNDQGTHISHVKDLADIERNLRGTKGSNPFLEGLRSGAEAVGLGGTVGGAMRDVMKPVIGQTQEAMGHTIGYTPEADAIREDFAKYRSAHP